ncbi:MAG: tRNA 2-thiouridine(34) synthase MnmA [Gammaproteobacteria bacterium]|nr:tRNA 2-thiouridine(34) synthase MnmA [Gammaproteobacteria bacterium]
MKGNSSPDPGNTRVIVGMSGGVDSSVTALLCIEKGYQVEGLFMKNWDEDDGTEYCTAMEDLADAKAVCRELGIKLHEANFAAEYWDNVFSHFLEEYRLGRTPNPDVLCNREIKFNVFARYAEVLGADLVATGHYARLETVNGNLRLMKAEDRNKDQSYFLQSVTHEQFSNVIFPLGDLNKDHVRVIARENGLPVHSKKDSTGICFIGERRFKDFLQTYLPANPGDIVDLEDKVIGQHDGLMYHTLGQRQGLRIGGLKGSKEQPWYVAAKDLDSNRLIVAQGNDNPALFCSSMNLKEISWIGRSPDLPSELCVKTRYRQADQLCHIDCNDAGYFVRFREPQRAVTPGQWACFYDGDICLGGGIIVATDNPL